MIETRSINTDTRMFTKQTSLQIIYMDIVLNFQVLDLESEDSDEEVNMEINTLLKTYMQALQQEISITDMVNTSFTQKAPPPPPPPFLRTISMHRYMNISYKTF